MAKRKYPKEEKNKPGLNFVINLKLNFPISETLNTQMDFATACANNNISKTKKLKEFFYDALGIKDDNDFDRNMKDPKDYAKTYVKTIIKNNTGKYNFSEVMKEKIRGYIKENEGD